MGLYDTINDEQIKAFPRIYPELLPNGAIDLGATGGNLRFFDIGSKIPYKTHYYYIEKNFDIVQLFPYEHNEPMVHKIRNGKNTGFEYLKDVEKIYPLAITNYGEIIKMPTKTVLNRLIQINEIKRNTILESDELSKDLMKYYHNNKDDADYEEKMKEKMARLEAVREVENKDFFQPMQEEINQYIGQDYTENSKIEYQILGAIETNRNYYKDVKIKEKIFIVRDERLLQIAFTNKMEDILKTIDINDYFETFAFNEKEKEKFWKNVEKIRKIYEMLINKEYKQEHFDKYALDDIISGKYKEVYLKYDILPYKNFDKSIWG